MIIDPTTLFFTILNESRSFVFVGTDRSISSHAFQHFMTLILDTYASLEKRETEESGEALLHIYIRRGGIYLDFISCS